MAGARDETVLPPDNAELLEAVEAILTSGDKPLRLASDDGAEAVLPDELRRVLTTVVSSMHKGQAVTLAPLAMRLTTQQAADLLGVSRPTLVKLLEDGRIPYETPNRHRRIRLVDLVAFQKVPEAERRRALAEMAQEDQDLGLYDQAADKYESALAEARQKFA